MNEVKNNSLFHKFYTHLTSGKLSTARVVCAEQRSCTVHNQQRISVVFF